MKQLLLLLLLGIFPCSYAVNNLRLPDMRSMGMGESGATQSYLFNPALISLESYKSIDISYFNRYGLKELGTVNLSFACPNRLLPWGVSIASFGYDRYRESMFRLSFGKYLSERWSVGVGIQYYVVQTELVDVSPQYLSTDVGILYSPVEKLLISMLIMDLPSVSIRKETIEKECFIGYSLQISFQWEVINNVLITGTMGTDKYNPLIGNAGLEYRLYGDFRVRAGIKAAPLLPSLGVGYSLAGFSVDVAAEYHPVLGVSTGIGLKYSF